MSGLDRFGLLTLACLPCLLSGGGCTATTRVPHSPATAQQTAQLCQGVPDSDRERPTFLQPTGIEGVRPLMGERQYIKFTRPELRGAELFVRPVPALTRQWLAHVLRCHMAWRDTAALQPQVDFEDPLEVGQPDVSVVEIETGFVVRIAGHDKADGEEILRRAQRIAEPPPAAARN